jgi:hypothetical protein
MSDRQEVQRAGGPGAKFAAAGASSSAYLLGIAASGTAANTMVGDLERILTLARAPVKTANDLRLNLANIYRELYMADFGKYDVVEVRRQAAPTMQHLFELRLLLRQQIADWAHRGLMSQDVQRAVRDVFRVTRYASDMLGELHIGHDRMPQGAPSKRGFTGSDYNTLLNPAFGAEADLPFHTGDVILVRGQAHNSAAIARIGDVDSQFSHVGMVYVAPDGQPFVVEALIESGTKISRLEEALDHGLGRAVLFRHRDPVLAAKAAKAIHDHVRRRKGLRHIWYDFSMRLDGYRRLYCSKLIRLAFLQASKGQHLVPAYTTRLERKNRDFLDRVGVDTVETFAPGDLEIDHRFDVVAEWQDYRITAKLRNQDMILTKLFDFMDAHNYRFEEDTTIRLIGWMGRLSALMSEDAKDMLASVVPKVPPNMGRKTIAVVAMLHKTAEPLLQTILEQDRAEIERSGRPRHPRDVLAYMDQVHSRSGGRIGYLVIPSR